MLLLGVVALVVVGFGVILLRPAQPAIVFKEAAGITASAPPALPAPGATPSATLPAASPETAQPAPPTEIVVHVAGAVRKPGVYRLAPDARSDDALKAAGGAKPNANTDALNLAAKVEDGMRLYVPTRAEHPDGSLLAAEAPPPSASSASTSGRRSGSPAAKPGGKSGTSGKLSRPGEGTVNVNAAGAEELQRLPGIGPAMAERLLEYRQANGSFASADDLLQVSGIGPKKLEKMRPFVRVR